MAQKPICKIAIQGCLQLIELFNFSLCIINLGFIYLIAGLRRRRSIQVGNQSLGIGECSYLSLDKPQGKGLYILLFDRFLGTNGGIVILMESAIIVITAIDLLRKYILRPHSPQRRIPLNILLRLLLES